MKKLVLVIMAVLFVQAAWGGPIRLNAAVSKPLLPAGQRQTAYIKVGLTGVKPDKKGARAPANIAVVLDKSGSMTGEKIAAARQAAIDAIRRLNRDDIVSVITYDSTVNVLVPATRLTEPEAVISQLRRVEANGSTALFAGVSKAAEELRKFKALDRVNRMVLLSDGLANIGPSSPSDLAELGQSLGREGIAVTTIGLGLDYNEDLMAKLAANSNGRHYFAREARQLASLFDKEFGDVMAIVAQEVELEIRCADGIRPVRILGRGGRISGQSVKVDFNQLYSNVERYAICEMEVPAGEADRALEVAYINVKYDDMQTRARETLTGSVGVRFTNSLADVARNENRDVMISVVELIGAERNMLATELRDRGRIEDARRLLGQNVYYLNDNAVRYQSDILTKQYLQNKDDAANLDDRNWQSQRKIMRENQAWSNYK
ncbi:VWA domain-containing protein [bacterium]|nr:VWA domain-containing protein [bacterium]